MTYSEIFFQKGAETGSLLWPLLRQSPPSLWGTVLRRDDFPQNGSLGVVQTSKLYLFQGKLDTSPDTMQSMICVERKLKCMYRLVLLRQSNSVRPMALDTAPRSIKPILLLCEMVGHTFIFMSVMRFRKT